MVILASIRSSNSFMFRHSSRQRLFSDSMTGDNDVAEVCRQLEVSQPTYYIPPATTPTKSVTYAPQFIAQTNHSASDPTGSKNLSLRVFENPSATNWVGETDPNDPEIQPIVLFVVALALFYFVADVALHSSYKQEYHRVGRWILVGALLVGWLVGTKFKVSVTVIASFVAFFAGGILVTGLGNELRTGLSRKVWAFGIAAIAYSFLMMFFQPA